MTIATEVAVTYRPAGQTLNYGATTTAPNFFAFNGTGNFVGLLNTGTVPVVVSFGAVGGASGLTFPSSGTSSGFVLPASMTSYAIIPKPDAASTGIAIVASSGTATVFVTLLV